jgi:hypothetical protein
MDTNKMNIEEQLYSPWDNAHTRKVWNIKKGEMDGDNIENIWKSLRDEYIKDFRDI